MSKYRFLLLALIVVMAAVLAWVFQDNLNEDGVTPNEEFFTLSIGRVPHINGDAWALEIDGHVENATTLSLWDLMAMPAIGLTAELKCVEGPSGTALWRGVRLGDVLDLVRPMTGSVDVVFHASDGYNSSLKLDYANRDDVLLAYMMNDETLPPDQGFPLKVVAPGKAGYKWVKWIVRIEVVDYDHEGYWESRGWDDEGDLAMWADWAHLSMLLTLAAVLGGVSAIGGLRFSRETRFWRDLPEWFTREFHIKVSWAFFIVMYAAFAYWVVATIIRRGDIFYSSHGILALMAVVSMTIGLVTGYRLAKEVERWRMMHLVANLLGYLLLIGTIALGLIRI